MFRGHLQRVDLEQVSVAAKDCDEVILAVDEALEKLAAESPQKAEIVKLRYFVGLEYAEIAEVLDVSEPTVRRHWAYARAWLYAELKAQLEKHWCLGWTYPREPGHSYLVDRRERQTAHCSTDKGRHY